MAKTAHLTVTTSPVSLPVGAADVVALQNLSTTDSIYFSDTSDLVPGDTASGTGLRLSPGQSYEFQQEVGNMDWSAIWVACSAGAPILAYGKVG